MSKGENIKFIGDPISYLSRCVLSTWELCTSQQRLLLGQATIHWFDIKPMKSWSRLNAIRLLHQYQDTPFSGLWLPQGESIELPTRGTPHRFVFTPELTGCNLYVDRMTNGNLRVYHVHMDHVEEQYGIPALFDEDRMIDRIHWEDYGVNGDMDQTRATLVLYFLKGHWWVIVQKILGPPEGALGPYVHARGYVTQSVRGCYTRPLNY